MSGRLADQLVGLGPAEREEREREREAGEVVRVGEVRVELR